MSKWKTVPFNPTVESPTWGDMKNLADQVMSALGGNAGAANQLSQRNFYTLAILASLKLSIRKAKLPIFGEKYLAL